MNVHILGHQQIDFLEQTRWDKHVDFLEQTCSWNNKLKKIKSKSIIIHKVSFYVEIFTLLLNDVRFSFFLQKRKFCGVVTIVDPLFERALKNTIIPLESKYFFSNCVVRKQSSSAYQAKSHQMI